METVELRYFSDTGREEWKKWLENLRSDPTIEFPGELLANPDFTHRAPGNKSVEVKIFDSRFDLAAELLPCLKDVREAGFHADRWPGLYDWLAGAYFDSICPLVNGKRKLREQARYLFDPGWRRRYRHRIFGPVGLYERIGEWSRLLLHGAPSVISDWEEQAVSKHYLTGNPNLCEALFRLYWDDERDAPKRGAAPNKRKAGTLRRFDDVTRQFDRTFDLMSVESQAIMNLLPKEFNKFKPKNG